MSDNAYYAIAATNPDVCGMARDLSLTKAQRRAATEFINKSEKRMRKRVKIFKFGRGYKNVIKENAHDM